MARSPSEQARRDLDAALSKINAMEVSAADDSARGAAKVLRAVAEAQLHTVDEIEHLKKAIDLLTQMLFDKKSL